MTAPGVWQRYTFVCPCGTIHEGSSVQQHDRKRPSYWQLPQGWIDILYNGEATVRCATCAAKVQEVLGWPARTA